MENGIFPHGKKLSLEKGFFHLNGKNQKCFKCNLVFPKLSQLKKGQRVKGFSTKASKCLRVAKMPWDKSNYTRIIFSVEFKPEQLFQHDAFLDFLVFLWTFWPLFRIDDT